MNALQLQPWRDQAIHGGALRYAPDRVTDPGSRLFDPTEPALGAQPVRVGGRQSAWFVSGDFGAAVLRHYRRGGLMARLNREHYLWLGADRTRPFAEFAVLQHMHALGLRVPAALAAAYWRTGICYRAAILVERIAATRTLAEELTRPEQVAQAIHAMHEAGVWHADLNAFNILLDPEGRVWLIDFDRARIGPLTPAQRQGNLQRLRRSLLKVAGAAGLDYWQQLYAAYTRGRD